VTVSMLVILFLTITTTYLLILFVTKENPFIAFYQMVKGALKKKIILIHFICLSVVLLLNKIELKIENKWIFIKDKAYLFYTHEKDLLETIQRSLENDLLTFVLTYFYIIVFTSMMIASLIIYHQRKETKTFYAFFYAIGLNYLIAIPFYLFFPVSEVWHVHPQVEFLIPNVYQGFENEYRNLSGLNNCFPSLHNSISMTLAILAFHSGIKKMKILIGTCTSIIMFSTIYLGIHWFADMLAGVALSFVSTTIAIKLSHHLVEKKGWGKQ